MTKICLKEEKRGKVENEKGNEPKTGPFLASSIPIMQASPFCKNFGSHLASFRLLKETRVFFSRVNGSVFREKGS